MVQQCLDMGVDPNEHPGMPRAFSPLMLASQFGHLSIVHLLLERKAAIDFSDGDGFTALTIACEFRFWDIVKLLAEYGASFTLMNATGRNGLDYLKPGYCRSQKTREAILQIIETR